MEANDKKYGREENQKESISGTSKNWCSKTKNPTLFVV
jgi:hypothetical protein